MFSSLLGPNETWDPALLDITPQSNMGESASYWVYGVNLVAPMIVVALLLVGLVRLWARAEAARAVEANADAYRLEDAEILGLSAQASRDERTGAVLLSLVNPHPARSIEFSCDLGSRAAFTAAAARALSAERIDALNSFDAPDRVSPRQHPATLTGNTLSLQIPSKSVVTCQLEHG